MKGWALPSLGVCMWASWTRQWAHWAYQALAHNLPSSAAPFTPFDPSPSCRRSSGVTVKKDKGDGPSLRRVCPSSQTLLTIQPIFLLRRNLLPSPPSPKLKKRRPRSPRTPSSPACSRSLLCFNYVWKT